jgi:hypothetical protein
MRILLIIFCGTLLLSCEDFFETTIEIDPPAHDPILVGHCSIQMNADEIGCLVSISQTIDQEINVSDEILVEDAIVELKGEDGTSFLFDPNTMQFGPFNYALELTPNEIFSPGNLVSLSISAPGFPDIRAQQTIPDTAEISNVRFNELGGIDLDGDEQSEISFILQDPSGIDNYYEFVIITNFENQLYTQYTSSEDPSTSRSYSSGAIIASDSSFDGEEKRFTLKINRTSTEEALQRLQLRIRSITEDFYLQSKTLQAYEDAEDNPFTTPVQIHSNFEGGLGLFSIYQQQDFKIEP